MAEGLTALSRPYAWPWHGHFEPRRTAILVFRDGEIAPPDREVAALLRSIVALGADLGVTVADLPRGMRQPTLADFAADFAVSRPHHGGFSGTDLDVLLRRRKISDLIFAGFPFELGADCTMRQANDLGYECIALTDCCTGLAPDTLAGALASIQMSGGIFGAVAEASSILELFATAREAAARHPSGG